VRVALLFVDGVGVGLNDPDVNPLARGEFLLSQFLDGTGSALPGGQLSLVDATFGMAGRPQSASNQTALLTGLPAPLLAGRHVLGYPCSDRMFTTAPRGNRPARLGRVATPSSIGQSRASAADGAHGSAAASGGA